MIADGGTVFHGNAALFIDKHTQIALRGQFEVHQLVAQARQGFIQNILNIHAAQKYKNKKMAGWPFFAKFEKFAYYNRFKGKIKALISLIIFRPSETIGPTFRQALICSIPPSNCQQNGSHSI